MTIEKKLSKYIENTSAIKSDWYNGLGKKEKESYNKMDTPAKLGYHRNEAGKHGNLALDYKKKFKMATNEKDADKHFENHLKHKRLQTFHEDVFHKGIKHVIA